MLLVEVSSPKQNRLIRVGMGWFAACPLCWLLGLPTAVRCLRSLDQDGRRTQCIAELHAWNLRVLAVPACNRLGVPHGILRWE